MFPVMKTSGHKSVSSPMFEDGPGQEAATEKIDPLEVTLDRILLMLYGRFSSTFLLEWSNPSISSCTLVPDSKG